MAPAMVPFVFLGAQASGLLLFYRDVWAKLAFCKNKVAHSEEQATSHERCCHETFAY